MKSAPGFIISTAVYLVAMVIFAALLISFGYNWYSAQKSQTSTDSGANIVPNQIKTYVNPNLKYSLKYPADWKLEKTSSESVVYIKTQNISENPVKNGTKIMAGAKITVNFTRVPASGQIDPDFKSYFESTKITKQERSIFNSSSSISYLQEEDGQITTGVFFQRNGKIATISLSKSTGDSNNYLDTFNELLASFKFI